MRELLERYGGRLAVAIDAKDGEVVVRGWTEATGRRALDLAGSSRAWACAASSTPTSAATAPSPAGHCRRGAAGAGHGAAGHRLGGWA
jgi:hypothetical protein